MVQAVLPLKDLVAAKTRLAGLLNPSERRALAQAMVEDVLAVLADHPEISGITLVSDDPGAELLAARYGANCLSDKQMGGAGLNAVVTTTCDMLQAQSEEPLLVLHGDLPLLTAVDLSVVLACYAQHGGLVVACDRFAKGSNVLMFERAATPQFAYGEGSCARHLACVRDRGLVATVVENPNIALDVDRPEDIGLLMPQLAAYPKGKTTQLLLGTDLGRRISRQLASIDGNTENNSAQGSV